LTASDIREIYELRALLEGYAAKLATERVTAVDIDRLQSIYDEMQALADGDELSTFVQKDMEFHREICRLSGNQRLLKVWNSLAAQVRLLAILAHHLFLEPRIIVETHIETLKAMQSRDSGWVEKVVKEKILMVGQAITQALEEREPAEM
jgi:DNA-binding GntR family transcriptional regulator